MSTTYPIDITPATIQRALRETHDVVYQELGRNCDLRSDNDLAQAIVFELALKGQDHLAQRAFLRTSDEWVAKTSAEIAAIYRKELGREPDAGGLRAFLQAMRDGMSLAQVEQVIHDSEEAVERRKRSTAQILHPRHGLVRRGPARTVIDDDGEFYPLDTNAFFNLPFRFRSHRAQADRALKHARHVIRADSVRYMTSLHFSEPQTSIDCSVDPRWPDYDQVLTSLIDIIHGEHEMRSSLSVLGPDYWFRSIEDFEAHARRVCAITRPRAHKILKLEVCNEAAVTFRDQELGREVLRRCTKILIEESGVALVGSSSDIPLELEDRSKSQAAFLTRAWGATIAVAQVGRTFADDGFYQAAHWPSQWRRYPDPVDNNEPFGPGSSGVASGHPVHLATHRACCIMFGGPMWTLHLGAGITGAIEPGDGGIHPPSPANPDETPDMAAIAAAVRGVDRFLPPQACDGRYQDMRVPGALITCKGAYRAWLLINADGKTWWGILAGIQQTATVTPSLACDVESFDSVTGQGTHVTDVHAGQVLGFTPDIRDARGFGTVMLRGRFTAPLELPAPPQSEAEWEAWFHDVKQRHGLSTLTQESAAIYDAEAWLVNGEGEKNQAGEFRGRTYEQPVNGDPYARFFDMGSFGGPLHYVRRF